MASNRPHTWKDEWNEQQRARRDEREAAQAQLQKLADLIGWGAYETWVNENISDRDRWPEIGQKARRELETIALDAEQQDHRDTIQDTRSWARGG